MGKSNKTTEKFGKTMDTWNKILGKSWKMVYRRRYIWGNLRKIGIEGSA